VPEKPVNPARLLLVAVLASALPAAAQEMQRCEAPDGRTSYVAGSCPPGTRSVRSLPPAEPPSAADQKSARQRGQQDVRDAATLDRARKAEEERLAREQEKVQAQARKQEQHCQRLLSRLNAAREELASAPPKKRAEATRRVKRAEELYVEDCGPLKP
jgi:hypothetical protein